MPKIIINDTIFFTAIRTVLISNRNSFRVVFDKIASVYFIWKIYLYFSIGNGQPREPALCQLYRHTFVPYGPTEASCFWLLTVPRVCTYTYEPVWYDTIRYDGVWLNTAKDRKGPQRTHKRPTNDRKGALHRTTEDRQSWQNCQTQGRSQSGGRAPGGGLGGRSPSEAERVLAVGRPIEAANFPHSMHF